MRPSLCSLQGLFIQLITAKRVWVLRASTEEERLQWLAAITAVVTGEAGAASKMVRIRSSSQNSSTASEHSVPPAAGGPSVVWEVGSPSKAAEKAGAARDSESAEKDDGSGGKKNVAFATGNTSESDA